ncbi:MULTISPECIES: WXG100 family type VII secretion target [Streptomycetaceae]|uniref:Uncharacterized protein n=1 Tax=Streptantibioticus cattleyicolor (strain ATCC 35852 / DSM 46488 / JCM 4925 / NBRC 14057 / NRRL 8057) TaxID=1003195 RepID=F8JQS4_STREN|nr:MULTISPECIES: WXG100 family type VII secretion target [Streptomycetaceae]AEW92806.1 hypothetical protein SCATT_04350 [Streptantibioticus cattleyicolor NRRL 8057 = DSM 46488]MYS57565.1 hypothetical protein [Streptomyces sp. SID5468]CCB73159.1 protein of unknown function [Streptantibioticus cattleyicolor NRRL 8057 = DSM 46488]
MGDTYLDNNSGGFTTNDDGTFADNKGDTTGDYSNWDWRRIMAAICGGSAYVDNTSNEHRAQQVSDPQTLQDAANAFWYTEQVLKEVAEAITDQTESLTGEYGPWQGAAAQALNKAMTTLAKQVTAMAEVLSGGVTGDNDVPQQIADNAQHLREAIAKVHDIDTWYAQQAVDMDPDAKMDNGLVHVNNNEKIVKMMSDDMRQVLTALASHYKVNKDNVAKPDAPNDPTNSNPGGSDDPGNTTSGGYPAYQPVYSGGGPYDPNDPYSNAPGGYGNTTPYGNYGPTDGQYTGYGTYGTPGGQYSPYGTPGGQYSPYGTTGGQYTPYEDPEGPNADPYGAAVPAEYGGAVPGAYAYGTGNGPTDTNTPYDWGGTNGSTGGDAPPPDPYATPGPYDAPTQNIPGQNVPAYVPSQYDSTGQNVPDYAPPQYDPAGQNVPGYAPPQYDPAGQNVPGHERELVVHHDTNQPLRMEALRVEQVPAHLTAGRQEFRVVHDTSQQPHEFRRLLPMEANLPPQEVRVRNRDAETYDTLPGF